MDGNGRWAVARGKSREYGHRQGVKNVREIVSHAFSRGVEVVSLFAFSTENWSRPQREVDELFSLIRRYFTSSLKKLLSDGVRLEIMGDMTAFPSDVREDLERIVRETAKNDRRVLNVGINYGGRQELARALRLIAEEGGEPTEENIGRHLYTSDLPDLDFVVRTSGEERLSNFMLWQAAYAELYFTPTLWPDFHAEDLERALESYAARRRRFGGVQ